MRIDREYIDGTLRQFALDYHMAEGEWVTDKIHLSPVKHLDGARINEKGDLFFKVGILLGKAYVMADEAMHPWIKEVLCKQPPEWWGAFPTLRKIDSELANYGREILDTHIYFLPSEEPTDVRPRCKVRWFENEELLQFRDNKNISHALCFSQTQPDRLAVAAYDGEQLMAMAGVSEDGAHLWQIGIDVLQGYEGRGLAANLVTLLKQEVIRRGHVPYYGTSETHAVSRSVAIASGFLPAWSEIIVKKKDN